MRRRHLYVCPASTLRLLSLCHLQVKLEMDQRRTRGELLTRLQAAAIGALTLMAACAVVPDGTVPATATATSPPSNKLGIHLLLDDGRNVWPPDVWSAHLEYARQAVGEWGYVTELVRLDDLDPARWQVLMDLCADLHLTPILRLATTYDREMGSWTTPQPDQDGSYRFVSVWNDRVEISFDDYSGQRRKEYEVLIPAQKESIRKDFTIPLLFTISGRILDSNRQPVSSPPFSVTRTAVAEWRSMRETR